MTTFELREHLDVLLSVINIDRVLPKYVFILSRGYLHIAGDLTELLYSRNRTIFSKKQQSALDTFHDVRKQSDKFPLGQIFHEAIQLQETLEALGTTFEPVGNAALLDMQGRVERFYRAFESFARMGDDKSFCQLMSESHHLYPTLMNTRQVASMLRDAVLREDGDGAGRLSLFFKHAASFAAVVDKLAALERGYLALATLMGVSVETYPLDVVKIETAGLETGGLWVLVQGHPRVMDVYGALLERFALFLYRRLAVGADGGTISDRVLASQSLVNLTDELERIGMRQLLREEARLQKTALTLRRDFVTLFAGSPSIRINETPFEVEPPAWDNYIAESLQLLPRYNTVVHLNEQAG